MDSLAKAGALIIMLIMQTADVLIYRHRCIDNYADYANS